MPEIIIVAHGRLVPPTGLSATCDILYYFAPAGGHRILLVHAGIHLWEGIVSVSDPVPWTVGTDPAGILLPLKVPRMSM